MYNSQTPMTGNYYQVNAMRTVNSDVLNQANGTMLDAALGLCGESGEVADMIKKHLFQGHELDREHVVKELGDIMWYIALMTTAMGWDLDNVMRANIEKLRKRYPDGFNSDRSIYRSEGDV